MKYVFVLAQLKAEPTPEETLEKSRRAVIKAKMDYNADFIVFPESFMFHKPPGTDRQIILDTAQHIDGEFVTSMSDLAKECEIWMVFGMSELPEDESDDRNYNSTMLVNNEGEIISIYRKTHMYDTFTEKESDILKPGDKLFEPIDTPFGKLGMLVCYELRFPEIVLSQALKDAEIFIVPSAWNRDDLKLLHWNALLIARAVENSVYVLACNQYSNEFMGESAVVDPSGNMIAHSIEGECLIPCFIDTERVSERRKTFPSFKLSRRPELYGFEKDS